MKKFLSCDWGTSSFRLRLVELSSAAIMGEENSADGIAKVFELWNQSGQPKEQRFLFYLNIIEPHIDALQKKIEVFVRWISIGYFRNGVFNPGHD